MVDTMVDTEEFRSQGGRQSIRNTMVGQNMLLPIVVRPKYTISRYITNTPMGFKRYNG